jgi:hypothetical protein
MCPLKLDFYTVARNEEEEHNQKKGGSANPKMYSIIYKSGDDVRQDQLVL